MAAGRPRNVENPERLWELFQGYVVDLKLKESEWLKIQYVGKEGERKSDSLKLPLTFEGFKRYCWDEEVGCIEHYFKNSEEAYEEFRHICSRIKNSIRENQILGGMLGVFNPSITQRLNGLAEKSDITTGGEQLQGSVNLAITMPDGKIIDDFSID
jgi:hypothetical protein